MHSRWLLSALVCTSSLIIHGAHAKPTGRMTSNNTARVDLSYAAYQGYPTSSGINNFLGMRYAAPPTGRRRFRLPEDPMPEDGVIDATQRGAVCYGVTNPSQPAPPLEYSEDCLYIDVLAPANATGLSVMLWIQGGGYVQNYNANYNGTGLIEASDGNVIVVTFNYRVGPYGFLASRELEKEANLNAGFHDQLAAIRWVQRHISAFGGDPEQVTIFGTSIGGGSVLLHTVAYGGRYPSNDSLDWSAGIAQSIYLPSVYTVQQMEFHYQHILSATNCSGLECLRSVSTDELQAANVAIPFPGQEEAALFGYGPVIDGSVFPERPLDLLRKGKFFKDKPLILGSSNTDATIFAPQANTTEDVHTFIKAQLPGLTAESLNKLNELYANVPEAFPGVNKTESPLYYRTSEIYSDLMFLCPTFAFAEGLSNAGVPVHMFLDRIRDPVEVEAGYLTPHTWEVQAVWGPQYAKNYVALSGANSYDPGKSNAAIVPMVQSYWISFVKTFGNPNTRRLGGAPGWLQFGDGRFLNLETNATRMERRSDDMAAKCALWETLSHETNQ